MKLFHREKPAIKNDAIYGLNSCGVAIAMFVATGDRHKARTAAKRFGAVIGYRTMDDGLTYEELFDFLQETEEKA